MFCMIERAETTMTRASSWNHCTRSSAEWSACAYTPRQLQEPLDRVVALEEDGLIIDYSRSVGFECSCNSARLYESRERDVYQTFLYLYPLTSDSIEPLYSLL